MAFLDTKHKKNSLTLTTLLLSALLLVLFYIGLTYMDPPEENGISVNFGAMDFGSGQVQPKEKIQSEPLDAPSVEPTKQEVAEAIEESEEVEEAAEGREAPAEKLLTKESEEAIKIKQAKEIKRKADEAVADAKKKAEEAENREKVEAAKIAQQKKDAEDRARQEQEAKKKRLDEMMGGLNKSDRTATGSEGDDNKAGDKGQPDGDPYAASYYGAKGSGSGVGGTGLGGRNFIGNIKVEQECNEAGKVVVRIVVDRSGKVILAEPGVKGSENLSPCLLKPAKEIALSHRWQPDSQAPSQQVGFVVVNFKLGE
ncbi:energy transducer TonB [uncultured Maribacter sp.]|uniref:energy transducer TonB n=1 Tax=uncultured Maribacter sp. TaxID=431308 RepID=UPI0030DD7323|tara:strand:- start:1268 stop:2203 length:936 start_codon:yes stop_codon:yes gene_type:complete